MSTWTHVIGAIRIDAIPSISKNCTVKDIKKLIGPTNLFGEDNEDSVLPAGSEGTLQYSVEEYYTGLPWIVIAIWGDLRDYDDVEEIDRWWIKLQKDIVNKISTASVRDGVLHVQVEGQEPHILKVLEKP